MPLIPDEIGGMGVCGRDEDMREELLHKITITYWKKAPTTGRYLRFTCEDKTAFFACVKAIKAMPIRLRAFDKTAPCGPAWWFNNALEREVVKLLPQIMIHNSTINYRDIFPLIQQSLQIAAFGGTSDLLACARSMCEGDESRIAPSQGSRNTMARSLASW